LNGTGRQSAPVLIVAGGEHGSLPNAIAKRRLDNGTGVQGAENFNRCNGF
jgi:hypothetical protein